MKARRTTICSRSEGKVHHESLRRSAGWNRNGENIIFRVAFKPTATIAREQATVTATQEETTVAARGRHDPCVLPRAVPMVEAMAALVLCDHALRQKALSL
jgi:chorismate synthase